MLSASRRLARGFATAAAEGSWAQRLGAAVKRRATAPRTASRAGKSLAAASLCWTSVTGRRTDAVVEAGVACDALLTTSGAPPFVSRRVGSPGRQLFSVELSSPFVGAPTLVVAPGYGAGLGMFLFNMVGLSRTHRVILVDWIGTGASDRPPFAPHAKSVAEGEAFFIDSLEEWRQMYGITEFALMGHSLGGYLASAYALKYPRSLTHLVLASPAGIPDVPPEQRLGARVADSRTLKALEYAWEAGWTPQSLVRGMGVLGANWAGSVISRRFKSMWTARKEAGHAFDEATFIKYLHAITVPPPSGEDALRVLLAFGAHAREPMGPRLLEAAAARRAPFDRQRPFPVTLLYGDHDWMDPRAGERLATELRRVGADARCGLIADSGHHLYLENPVAFDRAVVSRLRQDCRG